MPISSDRRTLTRSTLRDAAALSALGLLGKAMGLVITVLVARFLGPEGLGMFALLFAAALLLEQLAQFGLPDLLLREIGARPESAGPYWRAGLRKSLAISIIPAAGLVLAAVVTGGKHEVSNSLLLIAASMPLSAMAFVGLSVMQAQRNVLFVTWVSLVARAVSLLVLVGLLYGGMGITAVFVSRIVFAAALGITFTLRIFRLEQTDGMPPQESLLKRSLPFAVTRAIGEANSRVALVLVSITSGLAEVGMFDAADRVSLSLQAITESGIRAFIPVFAQSVVQQDADKDVLIGYAIKYVNLLVAGGAFVLAAFAEPLTRLLFGSGFPLTPRLLSVLLLAQAVVATDGVVRQALIAHGREYTVISSAMISLAMKAALIAVMSAQFGLQGAAWGLLLAILATFAINLWVAVRAGMSLDVSRFALRPMACILAAFAMLWLLRDRTAVLAFVAGAAAFLTVAGLLRVFPAEERNVVREAIIKRARRAR